MVANEFEIHNVWDRSYKLQPSGDYVYSSAGAYLGMESLIDIEILDSNNTVGYVDC